jgi:uncharacterized protein
MQKQNEPTTTPKPITARLQSLGAIGLLLLLQLPFPSLMGSGRGAASVGYGEIAYWLAAASVLAYVCLVERRPLASIGLRKPAISDLALGLGAAILMVGGMALIYQFAVPGATSPGDEGSAANIMTLPAWLRLLIVLRAAVFEEILYRGFAIERLGAMLHSRKLGAVLSFSGFVLVHLYGWDAQHLIVVAYGGFILTALYLWRRNLIATMLAHFLTDFVGFLLV